MSGILAPAVLGDDHAPDAPTRKACEQVAEREVTVPAWTTYASEARRMIAAMRAMG